MFGGTCTMNVVPVAPVDHDDSIRIIHRAVDAGINFVDTADVYSAGESEEIVGKALVGHKKGDVVEISVHGSPVILRSIIAGAVEESVLVEEATCVPAPITATGSPVSRSIVSGRL